MVLMPPAWLKLATGYQKDKNQPVSPPMPDFLKNAQTVKPPAPTFLQQIWNETANKQMPQQKTVGTGTTTTKASASAPKATASKPANVPVQIRQSDGTMKTGYINPADNLTYYDDGTRVSAQTGASAVVKGSTEFKVKGAGTPTPPAGTGGTAGTGTTGEQAAGGATGTGTAATSGEAKTPTQTQTPAKIYLPDGNQVDGYTRGGVTYYMVNGVETRIPTGSVVDVNNKQFQLDETGGKQLKPEDFRTFMAGRQAKQAIDTQTQNIVNFQNRLLAQKEQGILQAERGAEMARGGLQNRMFQDWLGTRQAMTERGLTGSGIAQDANTRLQLAGQQQLAELYTNLSNQINAIDSNYQLSNQEKEQQKLDLQNSFFQLRDQISSGMLNEQLAQQKTASEIQQNLDKTNLEYAKVFGFDPKTGIKTLAAQELAAKVEKDLRDYGLDMAGLSGYLTLKNDKGETVSIPTLDREKFLDQQKQAEADRAQRSQKMIADAKSEAQKATAKAFETQSNQIFKSLESKEKLAHKTYEEMAKIWAKIPEKDQGSEAGIQAKTNVDNAWNAWLQSVNELNSFHSNPSAYIQNSSL